MPQHACRTPARPRSFWRVRDSWNNPLGRACATEHDQRSGRAMGQEFGEWAHGWQCLAASNRNHHFLKSHIVPMRSRPEMAHLRSHSGPGSSATLCGAPTAPEFEIEAPVVRGLILERLRMPLGLTSRYCEGCGDALDEHGVHRAACTRTGRLRSRAVPLERTLARVCREAGATVRQNALLRNMNISVSATDRRQIEVLADGLSLKRGAQLAVDITLRSPVCADGRPRPGAHCKDGAVANGARADKERKYPELLAGRCSLVVVALETGGRWSTEALEFIDDLARAKSREAPPLLRFSTSLAYRRRWLRMLSVAAGKAFISALGSDGSPETYGCDGALPALGDLFGRGDEAWRGNLIHFAGAS